ncbi:acetylcholinesterase collagenic tail peptide-like [Gadus macrocephalus]|uniref:acetylcholinesterase collagenic tail peptide-like n=1 Tax=Gadus macrocephalus TaxID=80720 RepID=UPI0028CB4F6A|nr:acetylcholinesterase collagenic tail peptide-like [Gadus macrocephalus]
MLSPAVLRGSLFLIIFCSHPGAPSITTRFPTIRDKTWRGQRSCPLVLAPPPPLFPPFSRKEELMVDITDQITGLNGDKGCRGTRGQQGKPGPSGSPGETGSPGSMGPPMKGKRGERGWRGLYGDVGTPGFIKGRAGNKGATVSTTDRQLTDRR